MLVVFLGSVLLVQNFHRAYLVTVCKRGAMAVSCSFESSFLNEGGKITIHGQEHSEGLNKIKQSWTLFCSQNTFEWFVTK